MRAYRARYARANYQAPEPPRQPETVWKDLGSTFRTGREDRKARTVATGGGPCAVWFNRAKGGGTLERMIFG